MKKTKTLFDCSKKPKIPYDDWTVESHNTSLGKIDLSKLELYLDEEQKNGKYIEGNKLREKLKDKPVLNANVLDYLYEHQSLIPESWKGNCVFLGNYIPPRQWRPGCPLSVLQRRGVASLLPLA